jgi:hypothetical protein
MSGSRFTGRAKTPKSARAGPPWPAAVCCGSYNCKKHNRFGHRRPEMNLQPSTDSRKVFLPALGDRVCTLGAH